MPDENQNQIFRNPERFHHNLNQEITAIKDNVRTFIGDQHPGSDGNYKEAILKKSIERFLPNNIKIGSGFIVKYDNERRSTASSQIDLILYDSTRPILFKQDDFIIVSSSAVKGIIEVKTKITSNNLKRTIEKSSKNRDFLPDNAFNGIFSFDTDLKISSRAISKHLKSSNGKVDHLCLGSHIFIKYWSSGSRLEENMFVPRNYYAIYELEGLSYTYVISNLIELITEHDLRDIYGFLYPIRGGKEQFRKKEVFV